MAISKRSELFLFPSTFSRLQSILLYLQKGKHTSSGDKVGPHLTKSEPKDRGKFNPSIWKTYDSISAGIGKYKISKSAWTVLQVLRSKGYEAYLVGGCVRDLLLNRVPKDFDVITTASLSQVKKEFHHCYIVGRRFQIGHVHLLGTIIEVSTFNKGDQENTKGKNVISHMAMKTCDKIDILRWESSIQRDFTINGLFYDPSKSTVYDYLNGMKDLRSSRITTVIPAHLSFKEDCARILRGLRIAARLGFELSKETSNAIYELSYLVRDLVVTRLMMELDFMLSYGAAMPSIKLLQKYNLLEIFLPFHAAYLDDQTENGIDDSNTMLMKLFSNLDKLLAPDRPCDCTLWLGLLSFHIALIKHPQTAKVIQAFSALLYYGSWSKTMDFIKQTEDKKLVNFHPEIKKELLVHDDMSENLLVKEIERFTKQIKSAMDIFSNFDVISNYLARYPNAPKFSGKIIIFQKKKYNAMRLFSGLCGKIELYSKTRNSYNIDYDKLKVGERDEIKFVLGKVIMDTIQSIEACDNLPLREQVIIKDTLNTTETSDNLPLKEEIIKDAINTNETSDTININKLNVNKKHGIKTKKSYHPLPKNTIDKTVNGTSEINLNVRGEKGNMTNLSGLFR